MYIIINKIYIIIYNNEIDINTIQNIINNYINAYYYYRSRTFHAF